MPIYNPFAKFGVSGAWTLRHRAIDYPTPIGFKFGAPEDGIYYRLPSQLERRPGQAGHYGYLLLADGRKIYFCHLERHIAKHGQRVEQGDLLGVTGNTGYVIPEPTQWWPSAGAHMHTYGLTRLGLRWKWMVGAVSSIVHPKPAGSTKGTWMIMTSSGPARRKASASSPKFRTIKINTAIYVLGFSGDYAKVQLADRSIAYVHKSRVTKRVQVASTFVNLRSSKSTKSGRNIKLVIPKGANVQVLSGSATWLKVRFVDSSGKAHRGYVSRKLFS